MCYTALVLTMIFSMGEQVPYHHYGKSLVYEKYDKNVREGFTLTEELFLLIYTVKTV